MKNIKEKNNSDEKSLSKGGRKKVNLFIDEKTWKEFKRLAFMKHENFHGSLSYEVEEALRNWILSHTQNTHKIKINKINPQPRVYQVFQQVKEQLKQRYGYVALIPGQQVVRKHLIESIMVVRGSDERTVKRWLRNFVKFKLIKWVAGEVYEVL